MSIKIKRYGFEENPFSKPYLFTEMLLIPLIKITLSRTVGEAQFSISDEGIGIPKEESEDIFGAFLGLLPHGAFMGMVK